MLQGKADSLLNCTTLVQKNLGYRGGLAKKRTKPKFSTTLLIACFVQPITDKKVSLEIKRWRNFLHGECAKTCEITHHIASQCNG